MRRLIILAAAMIGLFSVSVCLAVNADLQPGKNANGFKWKRASDADRQAYCEQMSEKLGSGMRNWEAYHKSLSKTFDTESPVTLKLKLDDISVALKKEADKAAATKK